MAGDFKSAVRLGLCTALLAVSLAACGGGAKSKQDAPLDDLPPEEIYKRGELILETARKPGDSLRYFAEVERLYPYSEWARRALIMQAFSHHKAKEYEEARVAAQRFLDFYPADEDAAYALYLMALSYYDQIDEVGRIARPAEHQRCRAIGRRNALGQQRVDGADRGAQGAAASAHRPDRHHRHWIGPACRPQTRQRRRKR